MTRSVIPALKYATFAVCGYEAFAGFTRRAPTVSQLCGRRRYLIPIVVGGLALHLLVPFKEET